MLAMGETEIHHGYRIANTGADPVHGRGRGHRDRAALGADRHVLSITSTAAAPSRSAAACMTMQRLCIVMRPCSRSVFGTPTLPQPPVSGFGAPVSAGGVAAPETEHGAGAASRGRAPCRDRRRDRLRRRRAGPAARPPPARARSSGCSAATGSDVPVGWSTPISSRTGLAVDSAVPDSDAVFLALPHGVAAGLVPGLVDRGRDRHRPRPRLPPPRPGRLSALVRLRAPATGAPRATPCTGCPSSTVRSSPRSATAARTAGHRRRAGLLSDGDAPRPRPAGPGRPHRRPRRRCQERRERAPVASRSRTSCSARSTRA